MEKMNAFENQKEGLIYTNAITNNMDILKKRLEYGDKPGSFSLIRGTVAYIVGAPYIKTVTELLKAIQIYLPNVCNRPMGTGLTLIQRYLEASTSSELSLSDHVLMYSALEICIKDL